MVFLFEKREEVKRIAREKGIEGAKNLSLQYPLVWLKAYRRYPNAKKIQVTQTLLGVPYAVVDEKWVVE